MRITQATRTNWAMVLLSSAVKIAVTSYVIWIALSLYSWYMYGINTTVEEYTVHKKIKEWREILINVTLIGGVVLPGLKTRRNEESAWFNLGV
jgi:GH24 family phage-related lysozyme (muramidase)